MKRLLIFLFACLVFGQIQARELGYGVDAFNRIVPVSSYATTVFSPLSFEFDTVFFAEAVDTIRRARFSAVLGVMDEFEAEYRPLARPAETNGFGFAWARALIVDEPRLINPSFRLFVQDAYGVEVCRADYARGVEAWVGARLSGDFKWWRMPMTARGKNFSLQDIVSISAVAAPSNGWKRVCPTHIVYRQPLVGGCDLYAIVPKPGRPVSSIRARVTSTTISEILSIGSAVVDPPVPVRLSLPPVDCVATNELGGAFSYFRLPTAALKPFPPGLRPEILRQTIRFRLRDASPSRDAETPEGPCVFFVYDPVANTLPVMGIIEGGEPKS